MTIYNKDIEKQKEVLVEGILRQIGLPIIAVNTDKGVLFVASNPTQYIKKIRMVYPGIMFGAIGDIPVIDWIHEELVHMAHETEINYGDPEMVEIDRLRKPIQKQLLLAYSDTRIRPLVINFVLAQKNAVFIIDYTGSIEEIEENAFGIIGTKNQSDEKGQKQILTEILDQKLESQGSLTDLDLEQIVLICKEALTEAEFKTKFFEIGKLQNKEVIIKKEVE
jgi:20S proteasome alpha/beta subunit